MIEHISIRDVWVAMSALAGSITALAGMKYQAMTWTERLLTIFVGFAFAVIFVPWVAVDIMKMKSDNIRGICAMVYIGGTAWNTLIPLAIKKVKRFFGTEEKA